ncbi:MAG: hypothetical protein F6K24_21100 [Okeania sp. SIO2D1]|nr:hypothetical protein [Okeania sp. SIO2D1]
MTYNRHLLYFLVYLGIVGRKKWKRESGYHRGSLSVCVCVASRREAFRRKTTMFRLKVIFRGKLRGGKFDNQAVELFIQFAMQGPYDSNR